MTYNELGERASMALKAHKGNKTAAIADLTQAIRAIQSSGLNPYRLIDAVSELEALSR